MTPYSYHYSDWTSTPRHYPHEQFYPFTGAWPTYHYYSPHHIYNTPSMSMQAYSPAPLADIPFYLDARMKFPEIHPILEYGVSKVLYDVRQLPKSSICTTVYANYRDQSAKRNTSARQMRLIFKDLPWAIDVISDTAITCGDIWKALHNSLQEKLVDSDWGFLNIGSEVLEGYATNKKSISEAMEHRGGDVPVRVDWLGDRTVFKGLERDDEFARKRLLPGSGDCPETWIVRMDR